MLCFNAEKNNLKTAQSFGRGWRRLKCSLGAHVFVLQIRIRIAFASMWLLVMLIVPTETFLLASGGRSRHLCIFDGAICLSPDVLMVV